MKDSPEKKITVLHLIDSLPREGAEMVVYDLVRRGDLTGFDYIVCSLTRGGGVADMLAEAGIPVILLGRRSRLDVVAFIRLLKTIKSRRVDIVHTHLFSSHIWGALAARWCRTKLLRTEHNLSEWKSRTRRALDRFILSLADGIVAVSEAVGDSLATAVGIEPDRIRVIPNGLNPERLKTKTGRKQKPAELVIPPGVRIVATAAALTPKKGHRYLLEAAAMILGKRRDVCFLLMGEGELRDELEREVAARGLSENVRLLGSRGDALEIISTCDVFTLSSTREGLPIALLEAMALERAVVATAVGGSAALIDDGVNGLLVPPADPAALAEAVESLLENPGRATALGKAAARKIRTEYAIEPMIESYRETYREILGGKTGRETRR